MKSKVLIVFNIGFKSTSGLTSVIMNYYLHINMENLQIDFASTNDPDELVFQELEKRGSYYYKLPPRSSKKMATYYWRLYKLCKNYNVIHVNGNSATMAIELAAAKMAGVKCRIAHCHTSKTEHPFFNMILRIPFKRTYTRSIACSKKAGEWLYGANNYEILPNAIDLKKYQASASMRYDIRDRLNVQSNFVIGHVGRLSPEKNHKFLFDIFREYSNKNPDAKLLIVGDGPLRNELYNLAKEKEILESTIFTGAVTNVCDYLQAMDAFVFPSIYEGLPLSLIEAQAMGKECFISNTVTDEVLITEYAHFLSIQDEVISWVNFIKKICKQNTYDCRAIVQLEKSDFNIVNVANKLKEIYEG